jgi:hypothetical protein
MSLGSHSAISKSARPPDRGLLLEWAREEVREADVVGARRHRSGADDRGRLAEVAGALDRRDDHRDGAVRLDVAVEEAERIRDHPRRVVVGAGHRGLHDGIRVQPRVIPERDRHVGVLVVGRAELDAMAHRDHRHLLERAHQALRHVPLIQPDQLGANLLPVPPALHCGAAVTRSLPARPRAKDEDRLGEPCGDRSRRDDEHGRRAPASERRPGVVAEVLAAEDAEELLLVDLLHVVPGDTVDVARRDPRVLVRGPDRLDRHLELGEPERLREAGLADADDRGAIANARSVHAMPGSPRLPRVQPPSTARVAPVT